GCRGGGVPGRGADDPLGAVLHRLRDDDGHPAVLEAPGRVHPLELEVQLDPELGAERARAHERRAALAERERWRRRPDGQAVAVALDHSHPSSDTPRSETTGKGSGRRRTSTSASIAAIASVSAPSGASWVTTCSVAPPPFGCWRS